MSTELHPALLPLAFLLGTWRGTGVGGYPSIEDFRYGQEVTFTHAGTPVLAYASRSWALGPAESDDGDVAGRPLAAETGWWRARPAGQLEVLLAHPSGIVEIYLGTVTGTRIELATDVVARTESAKDVTAGRRLYGLVDGALMYAMDLAAVGHPLTPHLSARLERAGRAAPAA